MGPGSYIRHLGLLEQEQWLMLQVYMVTEWKTYANLQVLGDNHLHVRIFIFNLIAC